MPDIEIQRFGGGKRSAWLSFVGQYKPGDPPPSGYCDWHEWARVQHKAGLRQKRCDRCCRLRFPPEIATVTPSEIVAYRTKRDAKNETNPVKVVTEIVICKQCQVDATGE